MQLNLNQIRMDGGTQPRAELFLEVMEDYAEQMRNGVEFPPIVVFFDGKEYWLADGFHRMGAALRARPGKPIEAEVIQGTQSDAQWYSYGVNKSHGLRRTKEDRVRVIKAALHHPAAGKRSDRDIAEHLGVDHKTVSKYRSELELRSGGEIPHLKNRTGRDGKNYPSYQPRTVTSDRPASSGSRGKQKSRTSLKIHQPTLAPSPLEKMTAVNMPHNPVMGARTLIEVFDAEYLGALVAEITLYLKELPS